MLETVLKLALAVVVAVILVILFSFQSLDHNRSLALFHLGRMNKSLRRWMEEGGKLFDYVEEGDKEKQYLSLIRQYDSTKKHNAYYKADLFNQAHGIIFTVTADHYDETELSFFCENMDEKSADIDYWEEYNHYAAVFNRKLERGVSGLIGRVLRMKNLTPLDDLALIYKK